MQMWRSLKFDIKDMNKANCFVVQVRDIAINVVFCLVYHVSVFLIDKATKHVKCMHM